MRNGVRVRKKVQTKTERAAVEPSNGNVFADLGLPNAEEELVKAKIVFCIHKVIEGRGLTQAQAAEILGIDQPKVSALIRGKLAGFSVDRLFRFLNALGQDVQIVIRPVRGRAREAVTGVASV